MIVIIEKEYLSQIIAIVKIIFVLQINIQLQRETPGDSATTDRENIIPIEVVEEGDIEDEIDDEIDDVMGPSTRPQLKNSSTQTEDGM